MHHRNCQMHLQVAPVPERKTASKYVEHNVSYRSRGIARIRVDHVQNVAGCPRRFASIDLIASWCTFSLFSFFFFLDIEKKIDIIR